MAAGSPDAAWRVCARVLPSALAAAAPAAVAADPDAARLALSAVLPLVRAIRLGSAPASEADPLRACAPPEAPPVIQADLGVPAAADGAEVRVGGMCAKAAPADHPLAGFTEGLVAAGASGANASAGTCFGPLPMKLWTYLLI